MAVDVVAFRLASNRSRADASRGRQKTLELTLNWSSGELDTPLPPKIGLLPYVDTH